MSGWTLFSNHGHVLVCLARNSEARLRDVASDVGITERAVQKIVRDLQDGGMISITKNGRRNCYRIHKKQNLRHALEADCTLRDLLRVINQQTGTEIVDLDSEKKLDQTLISKAKDYQAVAAESVETKTKSRPIETEPPQTKRETNAEPGESRRSDSLEKQQGSLF
jgi:predicted ArsR family transcriptional regulator